MHTIISFDRLATGQGERAIGITNGVKGISFRISDPERPEEYGINLPLTPTWARTIAYDLLCKAHNVQNGIHDSSDGAYGQGPDKKNLTELEVLGLLGFDEGVED